MLKFNFLISNHKFTFPQSYKIVIITHAEEFMFYPVSVLSVCLSVCLLSTSHKTTYWSFIKILPNMRLWTWEILVKFWKSFTSASQTSKNGKLSTAEMAPQQCLLFTTERQTRRRIVPQQTTIWPCTLRVVSFLNIGGLDRTEA